MQEFNTQKSLKSHLSSSELKTRTIGFVPTMGALHQGHMALVKRSVEENEVTVVSIFVNPTQFNNKNDLEKYPRDLAKDKELLSGISNSILLFTPSVKEIYADDVASKFYNFDGMDQVMEGKYRKDHFAGVATIVEKLLTLVMPTKAYFGEKDFQQLQIIKKLVHTKKIPVQIVGCPIVREPNGLAMSSRNQRLSKSTRKEAGFIYQILLGANEQFGTKNAISIAEWATAQFKNRLEFELEYFEIAESDTLKKLIDRQKNIKYRAFVAVYADGVRLIDNIALN
ncbi:pantoate--beta-alanine ligase [Flavobacteriaceae bacterium F89]|uniref:Pantothenate synthetase n=1 Tax=Cerina litoralis TaxID=2874477 RepID=A0AAE3EWH1_9FLAO|nr:pantoate--beta-alanine ligase [Cerina litoralis]MCG2461553.1 pantoate--beta-alanine ligase [Cerina litoralis]